MSDSTITPDKIADVVEVIDKINCIFDQYQFSTNDATALLFTTLEGVGEMELSMGIDRDIICDGLMESCAVLVNHIRTFEECPHE